MELKGVAALLTALRTALLTALPTALLTALPTAFLTALPTALLTAFLATWLQRENDGKGSRRGSNEQEAERTFICLVFFLHPLCEVIEITGKCTDRGPSK